MSPNRSPASAPAADPGSSVVLGNQFLRLSALPPPYWPSPVACRPGPAHQATTREPPGMIESFHLYTRQVGRGPLPGLRTDCPRLDLWLRPGQLLSDDEWGWCPSLPRPPRLDQEQPPSARAAACCLPRPADGQLVTANLCTLLFGDHFWADQNIRVSNLVRPALNIVTGRTWQDDWRV